METPESLISVSVKTIGFDYYISLTHREQNNLSHLHLFGKVIWRLLLQVSQYSFKAILHEESFCTQSPENVLFLRRA